ncbi:UvrD-helicase domain-containing protein [Cupriavidus malaysiensis]|uniref:DNA 3'-5' helicase n=1 Tax=Cupriavidus malaysiensis TaxID=367825 RepID=A0ABN4TFC9_9BURK|nr:UvrD-helicase domain-containing protein [Cupriavidus malaysiensis]AOZ05842.1 helicase IV [Cupriavidus malaysiensis]
MKKEWAPSTWGRKLTRSPDWRLFLEGLKLSLTVDGKTHAVNIDDAGAYRVNPGVFWTDVTLHPGPSRVVKVDGLPNARGTDLTSAVEAALVEKQIREDVAFLRDAHQTVLDWLDHKAQQEQTAEAGRRWITHEVQAAIEAARPSIDVKAIRARMTKANVNARLGQEAAEMERSLVQWETDHRPYWAALNAAHTKRELTACKDLFDRVERKPLTEEQARAVICFDNRVQVVASAGSGKTSTMVAKAAYAIDRGFVAPKRIVMLAFNKQAAVELAERAAKSFERLGMDDVAVEASTFHALGLHIIGKATKEKPDVPDWATDAAGGISKLTEIVDQLKDRSATFRTQWDLFRFVFGKDLPTFGSNGTPDVWDEQGNGRTLTADGKRVRSQEEATLSNWLFYNGVDYLYEERYKFKTADEDYRQYRPDFFYPGIDLYHEHFALDANGKAPPHFGDYLAGVEWKRTLHRERGTALIETTSHQVRTGDVFKHLANELTRRGVELDPNPDREIPSGGQKPMEPAELVTLVRTFISHAKSNCLNAAALRQRLDALPDDAFKYRHRLFLDIAEPIIKAWDAALAAEDGIDFEDMLNLAAEYLESGRYEAPYELVMADEFQDASRARARLCRALVQKPGRYLFAVGDDWQSINRFAGADVSVMTGFREWFGHGQVLKLEQTFRCPQALCDVSSRFVSKNPTQISKRVTSVTPPIGPMLQAFQVDNKEKLADAIAQFVMKLAHGVQDGSIPPGRDGKVSVFVLGRYNADRQYVPANKARFERWVDVSFLTVHRSKGSEADYVILPEMLSVLRGRSFPNTRADDPVLALAMPAGDNYPNGEERRLFYVALTRARRSVAMFTARGQCSSFLRELVQDGAVSITDTDGQVVQEEECPSCKRGVLVLRTGPYGEFRSCSNFPACKYKPRKRGNAPVPATTHGARASQTNRRPTASSTSRR